MTDKWIPDGWREVEDGETIQAGDKGYGIAKALNGDQIKHGWFDLSLMAGKVFKAGDPDWPDYVVRKADPGPVNGRKVVE